MIPEYERALMTQIDNLNAENDQLKAEVGRLREFLQEVFPYIPQNTELARKIRAEFGTVGGGEQ